MKPATRRLLVQIHKWLGAVGALWIIVLGITGLILDHRDDWGWAWRVQVPHSVLPEATVASIKDRDITLGQANPDNADEWLVGGATGLWYTRDGGGQWQPVAYADLGYQPMLYAIVVDAASGWQRVWLATEAGLWSVDATAQVPAARHEALAGVRLTAMDAGAEPGTLALVEDRSRLLVWSRQEGVHQVIELDAVTVRDLPDRVSWSRFVFDLHLGRGLLDRPQSMLINDFGAVAFIVLPVSGLLYWLLPKVWRGRRRPSVTARRSIATTLYRVHAPVIGLLALIPLTYLAVTGIVMDHREEWLMALIRNSVPRAALPPVYEFRSLEDEIGALVAYPDKPGAYSIGTRLGVLTTQSDGATWRYESSDSGTPGFNVVLKRAGEQVLAGGMGGAPLARPIDGTDWVPLDGVRGMAHDVSRVGDSLYMLGMPTMFRGTVDAGVESYPFALPQADHSPLMLVMFPLHNGRLIHPQFRWLLDVFAIITLIMVVSGPVLWWRRRW